MKPSDVARYRPIVAACVSRDGRHAAVAVPEHLEGRSARPLFLHLRDLDADTGDWSRLPAGDGVRSCYAPSFSPQSDALLFMRGLPDGHQQPAWIALDAGAEAEALKAPPVGASVPKWQGPEGRPACLGMGPKGCTRVHLWVRGAARAPVPVTPSDQHVEDYAFNPQDGGLCWLRRRGGPGDPPEQAWIEVIAEPRDLGVDGQPEAPRSIELGVRATGHLSWSPDGRRLAFFARAADDRLSPHRLYVVDLEDGDRVRLLSASLEGHLTGYDWNTAGDALIAGVVQGCFGRLYRLDAASGEATPLGPQEHYLSGPHCDRSRGRVLFLRQDNDRPQQLCLAAGSDDAQIQSGEPLTFFNGPLNESGLRPARTLHWEGADGLELDGVFVEAEGESPPLLLWLHGGPAEHIARTFSPYFQVFAKAGFSVFAPNYRGSTGRDEAFLKASVDDLGGGDAEDVRRGLGAVADAELADLERTVVVGWSYGGTLALELATRGAPFKALAVGAPVVDWLGFLGAEQYPWLMRDYFPSTPPWISREAYDAASPATRLQKLSAPTLVLHGANDPVVPPAQSRMLYRMLKGLGVSTDLMMYPGEGHIPTAPLAVQDMLERMLDWFRR